MNGCAESNVDGADLSPTSSRSRGAVIAGVLALLVMLVFAPGFVLAEAPGLATVADRTPLLAAPNEDTAVVAQLREGDEVALTGQTALGYLEVEFRGDRGWVASSDLSVSGNVGIPLAEAAAGAAIRAAPMTDAEVLRRVPPGGVVILTGAHVGVFVAGSYEGVGGWIAETDLAMPYDADGNAR
jgi:hypothetical protein